MTDPLTAGLRAALEEHPSPPSAIDLTRIRTRGRHRRFRRRALQTAVTLVVVGGLAVPVTVLDVDWPWENSGGAPAVATAAAPDPVLVVLPAGAEPPGPRDASTRRDVVELHDGCLVSDAAVLVWPQGSGWDGDTQQVVLADGTRIGIGDEVRTRADPAPDPVAVLGETGAAAAARCGGDVVEVLP
ncbi:hypothetical protein OG218_15960 [Kineococcus sp. NBC_00420]|uniref:hypothetical protein n=1 Tax=Kineococcus sp. NBC_00420 TaxID=2903564 RepID=UPI002E1B0BD3